MCAYKCVSVLSGSESSRIRGCFIGEPISWLLVDVREKLSINTPAFPQADKTHFVLFVYY